MRGQVRRGNVKYPRACSLVLFIAQCGEGCSVCGDVTHREFPFFHQGEECSPGDCTDDLRITAVSGKHVEGSRRILVTQTDTLNCQGEHEATAARNRTKPQTTTHNDKDTQDTGHRHRHQKTQLSVALVMMNQQIPPRSALQWGRTPDVSAPLWAVLFSLNAVMIQGCDSRGCCF